MAVDLTGIRNDNEFYTHHYLSAILENDLKDLFKKWREHDQIQKVATPFARLGLLQKPYFTMRSQVEREKTPRGRVEIQRGFVASLCDVLGYPYQPTLMPLDDDSELPILGHLDKPNGAPDVWLLETLDNPAEPADPLATRLDPAQFPEGVAPAATLLEPTLDEIITRLVFGRAEPPRWILLFGGAQVLLLDRTKWNQKRRLRFDLNEILGRREPTTLQATAALLHRDSVAPAEGLCLLDTLDESSHKHAHAVSEDLKYALREAIELLGNEAVYYLREVRKDAVFKDDGGLDEAQLTIESLRYMYRLLFLFYIEARPELGYAPMMAAAYRQGYSLETLRDLELVKLTTDESRNGYFLDDSLKLLFKLIYDGVTPGKGQADLVGLGEGPQFNTFSLRPLHTHLFDPKRTPLLGRVRFRNPVLQRILELMSLSRIKGKTKRGRISYAQLGINQLGAVYEALLSFTGFFAKTVLYEVKKAKDDYDELETGYFVPAEDLAKYTEDEKVYNDDGSLKQFAKGTFIYRLAGRNRETSASYYTPEVLTRCLVKYALKELLGEKPGDSNWKTADEILKLTVCEPAMGSAAFLNEAINQLADAYLERKQDELGRKLSLTAPREQDLSDDARADPHRQRDDYAPLKQRVKMFIADRNVYGIDLNPVAVELAEVSLWLNTMAADGFVPWFGNQLRCGNSLIGAHRQVFDKALLLKRKSGEPTWLDAVPERVLPGTARETGHIYHFLVPDRGMSVYGEGNEGKPIREMAKAELKAIKDWRTDFCRPYTASEITTLEKLSAAIDRLWSSHTRQSASIRARTLDPLHVWGQPKPPVTAAFTTIEWKDKVLAEELHSLHVRNSSPYRRLRLVMDYWCALWFWPIDKADLLPTREEYLFDLSLLLQGEVVDVVVGRNEQMPLFSDTQPEKEARAMVDEHGFVNVDRLCDQFPRLQLARELAEERYHFLHWELEFADLFAERKGFDLILGNPPWIRVQWSETDVLGDADPMFVLKNLSATKTTQLRAATLAKHQYQPQYYSAHQDAAGVQGFLSARQTYPLLQGVKVNLYKCFLPQAWTVTNPTGVTGYLHPEKVYDEPTGGALREAVYERLRRHYQFFNEMKLFEDVDHHQRFSCNVYGGAQTDPLVLHLSNLFTPATIDACHAHDGHGPVPGIKDEHNEWVVAGHRDRVIEVGPDELALFARLYDEPETPAKQARLPALHATSMLPVLRRFAEAPTRLADLPDWFATFHFNETYAQKDGTIKRSTEFPGTPDRLVLSGPHFFVGNPLYKTPRATCTQNSHYDVIDLTAIPDDYLPRTNFVPACSAHEYAERTPSIPWLADDRNRVTHYYRLMVNRGLSPPGERTLQPAIGPAGIGHIDGVYSYTFKEMDEMLRTLAFWQALLGDFFVKSTGAGDFRPNLARRVPLVSAVSPALAARTLILQCMTSFYGDLWQGQFAPGFTTETWTKPDARLELGHFSRLTPTWTWDTPLRTDYSRRQALVEIDVLVAMDLGLTLEELKSIYRIQFFVLRHNESDTWYDQKGRIVYTVSSGLPGVGFPRKAEPKKDEPIGWEDIRDMKTGTVQRTISDDTLPGGPRQRTITYHAPFDRCDRERDYEIAWAAFESRSEGRSDRSKGY